MTILVLVLRKIESDDKTKYGTFYSYSKAEIITNESHIGDLSELIYTTVKSFRLDYWPVIEHNINISKYNPLAGSNYIKLPKELDHPRKGLINIQNIDDDECFKWCLVKYLNPTDHHSARITKADKDY